MPHARDPLQQAPREAHSASGMAGASPAPATSLAGPCGAHRSDQTHVTLLYPASASTAHDSLPVACSMTLARPSFQAPATAGKQGQSRAQVCVVEHAVTGLPGETARQRCLPAPKFMPSRWPPEPMVSKKKSFL